MEALQARSKELGELRGKLIKAQNLPNDRQRLQTAVSIYMRTKKDMEDLTTLVQEHENSLALASQQNLTLSQITQELMDIGTKMERLTQIKKERDAVASAEKFIRCREYVLSHSLATEEEMENWLNDEVIVLALRHHLNDVLEEKGRFEVHHDRKDCYWRFGQTRCKCGESGYYWAVGNEGDFAKNFSLDSTEAYGFLTQG